jgi:hypothetical protein
VSETETKPEPKPRGKSLLVYVGKRMCTKNKLYFAYHVLERPGKPAVANDGTHLDQKAGLSLYDKMTDYPIGTLVEVQCDQHEPSTIYTNTATRVGRWENQDNIQEWSAAHRAAKTDFETHKLDKRLKGRDEFVRAMEPLQRMYQNMPFASRLAFKVMVLDHIGRQPKASDKE